MGIGPATIPNAQASRTILDVDRTGTSMHELVDP
jgi:hypothetical protein